MLLSSEAMRKMRLNKLRKESRFASPADFRSFSYFYKQAALSTQHMRHSGSGFNNTQHQAGGFVRRNTRESSKSSSSTTPAMQWQRNETGSMPTDVGQWKALL
eukprot:1541200-Pleurochrysis_carterae.AAC.2